MFPKPKRHEDRALLDEAHTGRCVVCNRIGCDAAHIKSKGSGGPDEWWNILFLCRVCHTRQHSKGHFWMAEKYPLYKKALESRGWYFDENKKIRRDK